MFFIRLSKRLSIFGIFLSPSALKKVMATLRAFHTVGLVLSLVATPAAVTMTSLDVARTSGSTVYPLDMICR